MSIDEINAMPDSSEDRAADGQSYRVERVIPSNYGAYLKDKYRPPSRGGNTCAWHQHVLTIDGERYSFLALGARKWAFAGESVSFSWSWDASKQFRNIDPDSMLVEDKKGRPVVCGERGGKKWRSADTRPPGRRSEWND
jgi:hypothetical protein